MVSAQRLMSGLVAVAAVIALGDCRPAGAQTVHALLVGDTDSNLSDGVIENLRKMNNLLTGLSVVGKLKVVRSKELRDDAFTCDNIRFAVKKLKLGTNDAVIFYYAGHGFRRNTTQSKFPEFDCPHPRARPGLDMNGVVKVLLEKNPRFVLAIADACNEEIRVGEAPARAPLGAEQDRKAGLRRLFLGYKGRLVMSGAVPGEFAWYMTQGSSLGGFFSNRLVSVLDRRIAADAETVRWEDIAADATKPIEVSSDPERPRQQQPQFEADLTVLPAH
jgi:hypothetical protein